MDDGYPETGWVVGESGGSKCDEDSATTSKYLDVNKEFGDSHNCLMLFFFNRR